MRDDPVEVVGVPMILCISGPLIYGNPHMYTGCLKTLYRQSSSLLVRIPCNPYDKPLYKEF